MASRKVTGSGSDPGATLGIIGGVVGILTGLVQMSEGESLRWLTGYNASPVIMGIITILLSFTALYSAFRWKYPSKRGQNDVAVLVGLLAPAVICFYTSGLLWFVPGPLLLVSSAIIAGRMMEKRKGSKMGAGSKERVPFRGRHAFLVILGAVLISLPVVLGPLFHGVDLVNTEVRGVEAGTAPLGIVWSEDMDGNVSREEVHGVFAMHILLLVSALALIMSGIFSGRNIGIGISTSVLVLLIFFFIFIPNILFTTGMDIQQFSTEHFGSMGPGMYCCLIGSSMVLGSFLYHGRKVEDQ